MLNPAVKWRCRDLTGLKRINIRARVKNIGTLGAQDVEVSVLEVRRRATLTLRLTRFRWLLRGI